MSSRLFQKIREVYGLAYSIISFADFYLDTGIFGVYVETDKEKVGKALNLIREECDRLVRFPVSKKEITNLKYQLKGNFVLNLESTFVRMNRLAKLEIYLKKFIPLKDVMKQIDEITPDHLTLAAKKLFQNDHDFLTILYPEKSNN